MSLLFWQSNKPDEKGLNPCYHGKYPMSEKDDSLICQVAADSLNPCYHGKYPMRRGERRGVFRRKGVLILVIMENTL